MDRRRENVKNKLMTALSISGKATHCGVVMAQSKVFSTETHNLLDQQPFGFIRTILQGRTERKKEVYHT